MSRNSYTLIPVNSYVQDSEGDVFKVLDNHYLKLSPWKDNEDRRISSINMKDYDIITYKNACMIINKQFNATTEEWDKYGKHYIANPIADNTNISAHSCMLSTLPNHKVVIQDSKKLLKYSNNISITSNDGTQELKLIRHKGKVYYILIINEYLPRVQAYNMFGEFCQWCGIGDCKPIYCETDNKYI